MSEIHVDAVEEHEDGSATLTVTLSYGALVDYATIGLMSVLTADAADILNSAIRPSDGGEAE
jgi:hypothetical protein